MSPPTAFAPLLAGATGQVVERTLDRFVESVVAAVPAILAGVVFLAIAAVLARIVMVVVRVALRRLFPGQDVYVRFAGAIVAALLWFGVALAFLSVVGLEEIAAALGTASGFVALGVSYALSGMLADAVAGVYLLRDPDFNAGDRVVTGGTTATVKSIELRKTRLEVDGDTLVRANAQIEKEWTKLEGEDREPATDPEA